jgi:putative ABC transport system substrate-binding protein
MGDAFDAQGADALFLTSASNINSSSKLTVIVASARAGKIATASVLSGSCELGVIISLSADPEDQAKGAAKMVAEILKGKNPADIPANNTPKVEMTINLKEAKALGLNIPFELLGTAKVIKD